MQNIITRISDLLFQILHIWHMKYNNIFIYVHDIIMVLSGTIAVHAVEFEYAVTLVHWALMQAVRAWETILLI